MGSAVGWKSVERWKSRVSENYGNQGENRLKMFLRYLELNGSRFKGMSPDELVQYQVEAQGNDIYHVLDALQDWINSQDHLRAGSKKGYYTSIRSIFLHNRAELPRDPSFIIKSDVPPVRSKLTVDIVKEVILRSTPKYQAIFTIMVMAGLDEASFVYWNEKGYDSLMNQLGNRRHGEPIKIELPGRKANRNIQNFYTFFGKDAITKLENYMKIRGYEPGRIFKTSKKAMIKYWTRQLKRLGYIEQKSSYKGNRYGLNLHRLRGIFRSRWRLSGVDVGVAEFFIGHGLDELGYDVSPDLEPEWFMDKYIEAESWLNILSEDPQKVPLKEVTAMRRELQDAKLNYENLRKQSLVDKLVAEGYDQQTVDQVKQILSDANTVEEGLKQITDSGIMILHSQQASRNLRRLYNMNPDEVIVEGSDQLTKHLEEGYSLAVEIDAEEPKTSVSDETWIIGDEKLEAGIEKVYALLKNNGDLELRGPPDLLNGIIYSLKSHDVESEEKEPAKRYKLKKPEK